MIGPLCDELWKAGLSLESWYAFHDGLLIARAHMGTNVSILPLIADIDNYRKKGLNRHNTGNDGEKKGGSNRRRSRGVTPISEEQKLQILDILPERMSARDALLRGHIGLKVIAALGLDPPEAAIYHAKQIAKTYRRMSPGVYFLRAKHDREVWKIGKSINLQGRIRGYGSVLAAWDKPIFGENLTEAEVHGTIRDKREPGPGCELFRLNDEDLKMLEQKFGVKL